MFRPQRLSIAALVAASLSGPAFAQEATDGISVTADDLVCQETTLPAGTAEAQLEGMASGSEAACFLITFPDDTALTVTLAEEEETLVEEEMTEEELAMQMHLGISPVTPTQTRVIVGQMDESAPMAPFTLNVSVE
ncbi:hypothetical protein [Wenxinia marina]|uniref:Uncharacterized protein n=1 Tax=Wenxinia marina DSM 24838 TaxID=1123501 RepID=A0A0D0Q853_9RHOB|nr:hypothetical protein [Wenxinia marina]KIQ68597.1 hypothetical protein Wenmar_02868 [Wenxinia marina DSM 24838]GGL67181.1 hypothetical protein GCM10011392_22110 [Wenxinia marina]